MHPEHLQGAGLGELGGDEGDPQRSLVATRGCARQLGVCHGGDVDGVLPGFTGSSLQISLLIISYEQNKLSFQ